MSNGRNVRWHADVSTKASLLPDKVAGSTGLEIGVAYTEKAKDDHLPPKRLRKKDLPKGRWPHRFVYVLIAAFIPLFLWCLLLSKSTNQPRFSCAPDQRDGHGIQHLFAITPVSNYMSFNAVKTVDLCWNIAVGRGGQALLLWISYRVYRACLVQIMETTRVSHALYTSLALSTPGLTSLYQMSKHLVRARRTEKHILLVSWLVLSLLWVMIWAVFTDAITSYANTSDPWVSDAEGDFFSVNDLFNSERGFILAGDSLTSDEECVGMPAIVNRTAKDLEYMNSSSNDSVISLYENQTLYETLTNQYYAQLSVASNERVTFGLVEKHLDQGTYLVINALDMPPDLVTAFSGCALDKASNKLNADGSTMEFTPIFFHNGKAYDKDYPFTLDPSRILCGDRGSSYQWGFSLHLSLVFSIIHFAWTLSTFFLWIHATTASQINRSGRRLGPYRALLDLSDAIYEELGPDIGAYGNDELETELEKRSPIRYALRPPAASRKDGDSDSDYSGIILTAEGERLSHLTLSSKADHGDPPLVIRNDRLYS